MKIRYILPALAGLLAMIFAKRRSYAGMPQPGGWTSSSFGQTGQAFRPWGHQGRVRPPKVRPVHVRRRGPLSRLFGFFWGMFWLWFGLSFVFGWDQPRRFVFDFLTTFATDVARWATAFFSSVGGRIQ